MTSLNQTTLNKKTANTAAMVALLMIAGVFLGPSASAESKQMKVRFAYNPAETAVQIYADFERTAHRACGYTGVRPMALRKQDSKCAHQMLDLVVARLNRTDVAQVHTGKFAQLASR